MTDKESQIDEILVLESIYNDEEFQHGEENGLISGQFNVFLELPPNFSVLYRDSELSDESVTSNIHLAHLPPISLSFRLPSDYPSKSPPYFRLHCLWLNSSLINKLVAELNKLWSQNEGMVILYIWTHFLKEESLQFLGISDCLDITVTYSFEETKQSQGDDSNLVPSSIIVEPNKEVTNEDHVTVSNDINLGSESTGCIKTESLSCTERTDISSVGESVGVTNNKRTDFPFDNSNHERALDIGTNKTKCFNKANGGYYSSSRDNKYYQSFDRNQYTHKPLVFTNSKLPRTKVSKVNARTFTNKHQGWNNRFIPSTSGRCTSSEKVITCEPEVPLVTSLCTNNNSSDKDEPTDSCMVQNTRLDDNLHVRDSGLKNSSEKLEVKKNEEFDSKQVPPMNQERKQKKLRTHILDYLIKYDEDRAKTEFGRNIFTCNICFDDKLGIKCTQFIPCKHVYCRDCISDYFDIRIKEGFVTTMPCPQEKCKSEATQHQIRELVGPTKFAHYDKLLLSATLSSMADITYCPRTACQSPVMRDSDEKLAACPVCQYVFCVYCRMTYHGVERCRMKEEEKKALVNEYTNGDAECQKRLEMLYGKRQITDLVNSAMSENWILENSKPCPSCTSAIEKSDGCNKMVCKKCNTFFCWVCSKTLDQLMPYKHFYDTTSKCYNLLFEGTEEALE